MKTIKLIINIILGFGAFMVFNESDTFVPNLIGIACIALLVVLNADLDAIEHTKNQR